jgi:hypothetical protein
VTERGCFGRWIGWGRLLGWLLMRGLGPKTARKGEEESGIRSRMYSCRDIMRAARYHIIILHDVIYDI